MRTKNELYQEALRTVARRRQTARAKAEDARAEAEAAVPGRRHAEEEVRVRGIRCALAGASGKDRTEAAAALADARQKLTALLAASGRPADALEPKFSCKLCQDTGTVNGRTCSCVHKVMQQLRRQEIEQLSSLSISSFDTMELRYYPNTMDTQNGVTVRVYMGRLLDGLKQYAEDSIGTSDYKTMATQYGVSKDQAKQIVRQSATLQKLYKKKVGDSSATMPTAPTEPADGNEETASKDYADYIINLAGDEWDSEKGTWKDADGTYAKAFADDAFTADSATYKQAMTAYYTAYQQYSSQASSASSKWTEYANGLYAKANISIYGLFA